MQRAAAAATPEWRDAAEAARQCGRRPSSDWSLPAVPGGPVSLGCASNRGGASDRAGSRGDSLRH